VHRSTTALEGGGEEGLAEKLRRKSQVLNVEELKVVKHWRQLRVSEAEARELF
jgi:hypothetical protein